MKKSFERFYPVIVFLFACLLYVNTVPNDYNLDDELVTINHRTTSKGFSAISEIIHSYYYEDEMGYKYGYRPLTHISFAIEHEVFGENPHISHTLNVLLYALLCLTIYFLTQKLAPDKGPLLAIIVAVIFAVHPLHTEVVASIKNRDEILSLLLGSWSLLLALHAKSKASISAQLLYWMIALTCFFLGILAKQSIAALVILIPLSSIWFGNRNRVVFPLLFFLFGSSLLFYINDFNLFISLGIMSLVVGILLILNLISDFKLLQVYNEVSLTDASEKQLNIFFLIVVFLGIVSAIYLELVWLNVLVLSFAFLVVYLTKNELAVFRVSLLIFLYLVFNSVLYDVFDTDLYSDEKLVLGGFLALVLINQKFLNEHKYWIVVSALIAIIATSVQVDFTLKYDGFIFLYIIVVIAHFYMKPLWFAIPLMLFAAGDSLLAIFYGALIFFTFSQEILPSLNKIKVLSFFKKHAAIWLAIFIVFQVFQMSGFVESEALRLGEGKVLTGQVEKEEVDFVEMNRPILYVENPIIENWNIASRATLSVNTISFYIKKMIFPYPLTFYYGYGGFKIVPLKSWNTVFSITVLLSLLVLFAFCIRKGKYYWSFGLLFFSLNLVPYSNLIVPIAGIVGERLAFTASLGFSMLLGSIFYQYGFCKKNRIVIALFLAVFLISAYSVVSRNFLWENKLTLYTHDIQHLKNSAKANALLANEYMNIATRSDPPIKEFVSKASIYFEQSTSIYPDFLNWWFDLGRVYLANGEYEKSKESFLKAVQLNPSFTENYVFLLEIANSEGNEADIVRYCKKILLEFPEDINILLNLSTGLYFSENYKEAVEVNDRIIQLNPSIAEAYLNKAYQYIALGQISKAKVFLEQGKSINPEHLDVIKIEELMLFEAN